MYTSGHKPQKSALGNSTSSGPITQLSWTLEPSYAPDTDLIQTTSVPGLVGFVIAILTAHGPVETALSTFTAVAVLAAPQTAAARSQNPVEWRVYPPGGL